MKAQDEDKSTTVYDVYLTRDGRSYFSKRYHRESAAMARAKDPEHTWGGQGYTAEIRPIKIEPRPA